MRKANYLAYICADTKCEWKGYGGHSNRVPKFLLDVERFEEVRRLIDRSLCTSMLHNMNDESSDFLRGLEGVYSITNRDVNLRYEYLQTKDLPREVAIV